MNLLILGGTQFVGRHITEQALERGHTVTLFNRGKTNQELFPNVEKIIGNRDGGLDALQGRTWDAVLDVNGYLPRLVNASAQALRAAVTQYIYISTLSVYADFGRQGQTEDAPLAQLSDPATEIIDGETYGALKALCERAVQENFPERNTILRLSYIVGPHDHTDRWTYWMRRIAQGGEMLAPGQPDAPMQFTDARDVASFTLHVAGHEIRGIYNVVGPAVRLTWGECFETAKRVSGADTTFTWVSQEFLSQQKLDPNALPMFAPSGESGIFTFENRHAISRGLEFRALDETIRDTLEWDRAHGKPKAGLSPEQERALLDKWHSR